MTPEETYRFDVLGYLIVDDAIAPDYLDHLMHIDVATWLPNDVLLKADKMTMAHSLEGRVPFLDHVFAEFCARMPGSLKMKNWRANLG